MQGEEEAREERRWEAEVGEAVEGCWRTSVEGDETLSKQRILWLPSPGHPLQYSRILSHSVDKATAIHVYLRLVSATKPVLSSHHAPSSCASPYKYLVYFSIILN